MGEETRAAVRAIEMVERKDRVLIVEDEDNARKGYEQLLQRWGCDVVGVGTAEEALAKSDGGPAKVSGTTDRLILSSPDAPPFCLRAQVILSSERRIVGFEVFASRTDDLDVGFGYGRSSFRIGGLARRRLRLETAGEHQQHRED